MRWILILVLILLQQAVIAQRVFVLSVEQPAELGFSVSKQDTTIIKGNSVILGADLTVTGGSGNYQFSWSPGTFLNDPSMARPVASPVDTIVYTVTVTDKSGCSFSLNYTVNVREWPVGNVLTALPQHLKATLFPNPNNGTFRVKLSGSPSEIIELTVFDNSGRMIKRQIVRNFTGDHTETVQLPLVSGTYLMKIRTERESLSRQFIIH